MHISLFMRKLLIFIILFSFLIATASAATLTVGSTAKYKTIQKAVDAAKSGDTIYVNAGTYKEYVTIKGKDLKFQGQKVGSTYKYPTVSGFDIGASETDVGGADINGFKITKYGVGSDWGMLGSNVIRNNYFYNCGVGFSGFPCSNNIIMNNKFSGNYDYYGVSLYESYDNIVTGNTFYKAKIGLNLMESASCASITKNLFSSCKIGVQCYGVPDVLLGNTYKGNKKNINVLPYP